MEFLRSDLAAECGAGGTGEGIRARELECEGVRILHVRICTREAASRIGKPEGTYVTLDCGNVATMAAHIGDRVRCAIAVEIRDMVERMCGRSVGEGLCVLVAGLGNADVTPDALGPETVSHLAVNRLLPREEIALVKGKGHCTMAALATGVSAKTGLETAEFLRGAVSVVHPDLLIVVDALAARSPDRLGTTVQLSDTGICPGSGVGSRTTPLDRDTLGVPVMAIGVPTVVDSATLVRDALHRAGYGELSEELRDSLQSARRFFVAPREIDLLVKGAGLLLAESLEKALIGDVL